MMNDLRMPPVSPEELCRNLEEKLPAGARDWVVMRLVEDSGLSINVDGDECLTSIGIWPNGCCDVDFLFVSTERGEFRHFVFGSTEEAVTTVLKEIILAVERGGKTSLTAQKQTVKCEYQIQDESPP
ncbi:hypothetical protein ACO0LO_18410 [Undibacterium sp. TJN25]|uniref:hypothetical protein n=1 Tax=Undibacterium sp. TJN25 TaxID=3413056 RepID=UPI003BF3059E